MIVLNLTFYFVFYCCSHCFCRLVMNNIYEWISLSARPFVYPITTADTEHFYCTLKYVNLIVLHVMNFNK